MFAFRQTVMGISIKKLLFLSAISILVLCSACGNGKEIASAVAVLKDERVPILTESGDGEGGADVVDPNEFATIEAYLVSDSCAGPFRIGCGIPEEEKGFVRTESHEIYTFPSGKTNEIPVYIYEIGNEGRVKVMPQYDDTIAGCVSDKIGEIFVDSDLFLTDKGIGAMSSMEEFVAAYPDSHISYMCDAELFVIETPRLKNVQFVINSEYYQGDDAVLASNGSVELQAADFRKESYFTAIRIIK